MFIFFNCATLIITAKRIQNSFFLLENTNHNIFVTEINKGNKRQTCTISTVFKLMIFVNEMIYDHMHVMPPWVKGYWLIES